MTHTSTEQPWWRKHTDEIELKVASGEMNAATCFTKMLWLVSEAAQAQRALLAGWDGLTGEEKDMAVQDIIEYGTDFVTPLYALIEGIEEKLKQRNTAKESTP